MTSRDVFALAMELFDELCDVPPAKQQAVLDARCGDDPELRAQVERMLKQDASGGGALGGEGGGAAVLASSLADDLGTEIPEQVGRYRVVREIGRGGMGVVYEAEQENPKRRVALKVMRQGISTRQLLRRFQHEAHVLGQLDHRGIAQIYEADTEALGNTALPYFVMEYIEGEPLDVHVRERGFSHRETLELMARVCDAVHHAHQKGVMHRDLKPSNVLVKEETTTTATHGSTLIDSIGQPKILDFGIARVTDADMQVTTLQTDVGQIVGTVAYMSPEQLAGDSRVLDTRCDVYALGVMLYRMLSGRLPHDLAGKPIAEAARVVQQDEPARIGSVVPPLRGDVETIVGKAMEKQADRRYDSAAQLSDDIRRYLRQEPVLAHPPSRAYLLRRFAQRNKGLVVGVAAAFVLLVLGVIGTSIGLVSALQANSSLARTNAALEQANEDLDSVSDFQAAQLSSIDALEMGILMRQSLLDAAPDAERDDLSARLQVINFTDQALEALEVNIFERALEAVDQQFAEQPLVRAKLLQTLAETLRTLGINDLARGPASDAIEAYAQELGEMSREVAGARQEYGTLLLVSNLYEDAGREFQAAADIFRELDGVDSTGELAALNGVAASYRNRGQFADAITLHRRVLDGRRRILGPDHEFTISSTRNLAIALEDATELEEAGSLFREAYTRAREAFGDEDERTFDIGAALASHLLTIAQYDEALELIERTLTSQRRMLGDSHPETLSSINKLAAVLDTIGRYEEAEALYRECLEGQIELYGEGDSLVLRSTGNLGYILNLQGKSEEAEKYYRKAYVGLQRMLGPDHPHTLTSAGNLASLLLQLEQLEESEELHLLAYEGRMAVLGPDHPSTLNAVYNMGNMLRTTGKLNEAEPYLERALEGYSGLGDDHIGRQYSLVNLGWLREEQGRLDEAAELIETALESRTRTLGADHPLTKTTAKELEEVREKQRG
ncbi:MAG: serine/threonine-protein kinase [Planctomycetota bacterium]